MEVCAETRHARERTPDAEPLDGWIAARQQGSIYATDRGWMVGIVDSTDAAILRAKNPAVHSGDILFTPFCAEQVGIDLHNEIYELTR